jgi:PAS domain S-box-containing protein
MKIYHRMISGNAFQRFLGAGKNLLRNKSERTSQALEAAFSLAVDPALKVHQIFEFLPIGVIETTLEGKVVFCNTFYAALFGFNSDKEFIEAVNSRPEGVRGFYVQPEARDLMIKELFGQKKEYCKFQSQFYRRDRKVMDLSYDLFLRHDEEGNEDYVFGFVQDLTERSEFERKLKASEASYRDLIEKANSIIVRVDASGRIKYLNDFARSFFGYSMDEVQGRHVIGTILDGETQGETVMADIIRDICAGRDDVFLKEAVNTGPDGRKAWVSWTNKAIRDDSGQVAEILLVGADVTDRKCFEQSLKQQLEMEMILGQISASFAHTGLECLDEAIHFSLDKMNHFCQASAAFYGYIDTDGIMQEWYISHGEDGGKLDLFMRLLFLNSGYWWLDKLRNQEGPVVLEIDSLPNECAEAKKAGVELGFKTISVVPVFRGERIAGISGICLAQRRTDHGHPETGLLKVCGDMFLNLLERKKFHDEIAESRERFDMAVHGADLGVYDWDIITGKVFFNEIWFTMLGYAFNEFPHTFDTWKSLLHPDDFKRVLEALDGYLKGQRNVYRVEYRIKTKDGTWKWILAEGNIKRRTDEGEPLRMVGLHRDITDLKTAEINLRHQKDIVDSLIDNMPLGIFAKDVKNDFRILIWNRTMEELYGVSKNAVLGRPDSELFDPEQAQRHLKDDMEVAGTGRIKYGIHEKIQTPAGERKVQTIKVPVLDEDGKARVIFGILEDVTEKERLEMSLRQTQKMQAVGQLAAGVAHEVKNPLAIILLAAEGLGMSKDVINNEYIQNKVQMIKKASEKANKVIVELLKFSRLADVEVNCIDLHQVIDDAYFLAQNRGKEKNIEIQRQYYDGALTCMGNAVLLEQIFVNLFNNAIDAIELEGHILVKTMVEEFTSGIKNIVIEIEDNGPGIPEEILPKIFDPFFTTKDAGHGTGLGLSTVFTILEKHGGIVRVDRQIIHGTRFIITLPFYNPPDPDVQK